MQLNKDNKNLSVINGFDTESSDIVLLFNSILSNLNLTYINRLLCDVKSKGVKADFLFKSLFLLPFLNFKNIRQISLSGIGLMNDIKKDTLYDFAKNPSIPWRKILSLFNKRILHIIQTKGDHSDITSPKCFILDDTIIPKTGKVIEQIGKVFDHCSYKYILGLKMLTLGYWDGKCFLPLDFSIHNEPGKKKNRGLKAKDLRNQFSKARTSHCPSFIRYQEIFISKITIAIEMIIRHVKRIEGIQYVLADSWFIGEPFLKAITSIKKGPDVIGLMKTNRNITIANRNHIANSVPQIYLKDIKYSRKFKCQYISKRIVYKGIPIKAFWVKMVGQNSWKLLITTDLSLTFIKAFQYYQIRWSIEVFFKDCKQNLHLNACQSTDFDAHISHISFVFMNYSALVLRKRFDDYESIGALFHHLKHILLELTIVQKIWSIFLDIYNSIFAPLGCNWVNFIQQLIDNSELVSNIITNHLSELRPRYQQT